MFRDFMSWLGERLILLLRWYIDRVGVSWRREVHKIRGAENKWMWIGLCVLFTIILLPYLIQQAFADSFLLGLSFLWASFLAISFAYILKNQLVLAIVYVGVVFGREVTNTVLGAAKEEMAVGNWVGALIMVILGIYLITWANRMKKGDLDF